jgi:hypothetical protein
MPNYICPRCQGSDYFLRNETVLRAGYTNIVNNTKMKNVQQQSVVCKKCQEVMNLTYSDQELTKLNLTQELNTERTLLIALYSVCFFIGAYALVFGVVQLFSTIRGDEYSLTSLQSLVAMLVGIGFIFLFFLVRKAEKRTKEKLKTLG